MRCSATASGWRSTTSTPGSTSARWERAGTLGGVAEATLQAGLVIDASGRDVVLYETVGVGQSEVAIATLADVVALVLMPGSGDSIQALKAGIMEIPDLVVLNKSDLPAARRRALRARAGAAACRA